jgi:hypothetical protein
MARPGRSLTRRRHTIVAAGAVLVALGVPGCAGSDGPLTTTTVTTVTTEVVPLVEPLTATGDAALDAQLTDVARFVEAERGHPFREPVTVELLDDAAFRARLAESEAPTDPVVERQAVLLQAVGAVPEGFDLVALSHQMSAEGVLGFYDPETGELVVRGALTPYTRITLAHELTHALDDQWFPEAMATDPELDGDTAWARAALAEGSAQVVHEAYRAAMTTGDRARAAVEEATFGWAMTAPEGVPPDLYEGLTDIYADGLAFVREVVAGGGTEALDAVFAASPATSEQILHPARALGAAEPAEVAVPSADGDVIESGRLGEAGLLEVLDLGVSPGVARRAAEGWGGDAYVVFTTPTGACLRIDVVPDSVADREELASAVAAWANGSARATVGEVPGAAGAVRLGFCT